MISISEWSRDRDVVTHLGGRGTLHHGRFACVQTQPNAAGNLWLHFPIESESGLDLLANYGVFGLVLEFGYRGFHSVYSTKNCLLPQPETVTSTLATPFPIQRDFTIHTIHVRGFLRWGNGKLK